MNGHSHTPWSRLTAAARRAPAHDLHTAADLEAAPPGFATRVVARARLGTGAGLFASFTFERLAARALACSCAGALAVTVWSSFPTPVEATPFDATAATADSYLDPVGALLEAVQS